MYYLNQIVDFKHTYQVCIVDEMGEHMLSVMGANSMKHAIELLPENYDVIKVLFNNHFTPTYAEVVTYGLDGEGIPVIGQRFRIYREITLSRIKN